MQQATDILKQYWGYDNFRPQQQDIIAHVTAGKDALALLPTGGGKSICYQVPALMLPGVTIVVSPLIALMQDQVARLTEMGVAALYVQSGNGVAALKEELHNAVKGQYQLLYVSPERLGTRIFRDYLNEMELSLLAIDEAHCISQWGHDFRPSYLDIARVRDMHPNVPVLALTASATPHVQQDIQKQLRMKQPAVFKTSFARKNIKYTVQYSENKDADTLEQLEDCSIIYCRSRKQTETLGRRLQGAGQQAAVYHAGMQRSARNEAQRQWMSNEVASMVATTAFGMGIDKPDVRTIIHYDAPEHMEAYYQEAGRAGRDGQASVAVALYNTSDISRLRQSTELQYPGEAYLRKVYQSVVEYLQIPIGAEPDRYYDFDLIEFCKRFGLAGGEATHALKLLEREGLWTMTDAVYRPSTVKFTTDRHTLDGLHRFHPSLAAVSTTLLRMYSSIFHYPTPIRERGLAWQLRADVADVVHALRQMAQMEIIDYNPPADGPQLFFHHYRVDSKHLLINMRRIAELRQLHEARTEAMISYLTNEKYCREALLLEYFGEQPKGPCGHCDICLAGAGSPPKTLRQIVIDTIQQQPGITLGGLLENIATEDRAQATAIIRTLIDDGDIGMPPAQ